MDAPRRPPGPRTRVPVRATDDQSLRTRRDDVVTEEPLEIRLRGDDDEAVLGVTIRTPGGDFELAAGLCVAEGLVRRPDEIRTIGYCADVDPDHRFNTVTVDLAGPLPSLAHTERRGSMTAACGVCGKQSLDAVEVHCAPLGAGPTVDVATLYALPDRLREAQGVFSRTGGLHATGLFTADGEVVCAREDVGRHNAVDKVVGWALLHGRLPLAGHVLLVSGRPGFELAQKAAVAGVPIMAGISAPSSLSVDLAQRVGMTLVGFLRGRRANIYAGSERVRVPQASPARAADS